MTNFPALACLVLSCAALQEPFSDPLRQLVLQASPLPPLPASPGNRLADDPRAAEFGRLLFFDRALSYVGQTSCASCHPPEREFTNGVMDFRGPEAVRRRVPTLLNVAYYPSFGWGGRADSLWSQALGPLEDATEHDGSRTGFAHHIANTPALRQRYESLFQELPDLSDAERFPQDAKPVPYRTRHGHHRAWERMTPKDQALVTEIFVDLGKALEAYQRRLVTAASRFDLFVEDLRAGRAATSQQLSAQELRGLELFFGRADCVRCHSGPLFTDFAFHDTRVPTIDPENRDPARALGIQKLAQSPYTLDGPFADAPSAAVAFPPAESQFGRFRTPSLRVLDRPGGYFHEGLAPDLEAVLHFYSSLEGARPLAAGEASEIEPLEFSPAEIESLVAFLATLQGPLQEPRWAMRP